MQIADNLRERIVWLALVALTLLSWWLSGTRAEPSGIDLKIATSALMLVVFFKVRLVGMHFMELRLAPWPLRLAFEAWVTVTCAIILLVYWRAFVT